jgi:hypothetical protein
MNRDQVLGRYASGERDFTGAQLYGVDLNHVCLPGVDLFQADLRCANLSNAVLTDADLRGADLRGADLRYANLEGADLRSVQLRSRRIVGYETRGWSFDGTVWPTDRKAFGGATIDGVPFFEFVETLHKAAAGRSPEERAAWEVLNRAKIARQAELAAVLNDAPTGVSW